MGQQRGEFGFFLQGERTFCLRKGKKDKKKITKQFQNTNFFQKFLEKLLLLIYSSLVLLPTVQSKKSFKKHFFRASDHPMNVGKMTHL